MIIHVKHKLERNILQFFYRISRLFKTADLSYILPTHRATIYLIGIYLAYVLRYTNKKPFFSNVSMLLLSLTWFVIPDTTETLCNIIRLDLVLEFLYPHYFDYFNCLGYKRGFNIECCVKKDKSNNWPKMTNKHKLNYRRYKWIKWDWYHVHENNDNDAKWSHRVRRVSRESRLRTEQSTQSEAKSESKTPNTN